MTESRVHRLVYLLLAVTALVAATLACSPFPQPTPTVTPSPIPPPTATPRPTETPLPAHNVTVINSTSQTICYLFASLTTETTWGSDWLGSTGTIAPGESFSFDLTPGAYDMMAMDCNQNEIERNMGITITAAGYTWTVTGAGGSVPPPITGDIPVTLLNQSGQTVCYVRISPSTEPTWGDDWLGSDIVSDGGSYTFYVSSGTYDLRAEDCSNNAIQEDYGITITAAGYTWTVTGTGGSAPPPSGGGNVTVVNGTSQTICYLFASLTTETTWGNDWLGSSGTIAPGDSFSFELTPGAYDMMAMDCNQNEIERNMGVTITAAGYTWTVTGQ